MRRRLRDPAVLLVTWFVFNQPPTAYTARFDTIEACKGAAATLAVEELRLELQAQREAEMHRRQPGVIAYNAPPPPQLSAVCTPAR